MSIVNATVPADGVPAVKANFRSNSAAINTKFGETLSLKDFGAALNGSTDDTTAWQAAITYLNANPAGTASLLVQGDTVVNGASLSWGTRRGLRLLVEGRIRLSSTLSLPMGLTWIGTGSPTEVQFGHRPYCLVTTNGFSGPAIKCAGEDMTITIDGVAVYLHGGGPGFQIGFSSSDSVKGQSSTCVLRNVAVQCADVAASEGLRIENVFWVWCDNFAFLGAQNSGPSINIADSWPAGSGQNSTNLVYIRDGVIAEHGVWFNRNNASESGYTYGFEFKNICYETCRDAFFNLHVTGGSTVSFLRAVNIDIADALIAVPILEIVSGNTAAVIAPSFEMVTWPYGPMFKGALQFVSGVNWQQATGQFGEIGTIYNEIPTWPANSIFSFDGEYHARDAWRGSAFVPQMVPAGCEIINVSQVSGGWTTSNGTPTYTAAQTGPDGSSNAVRVQTAGAETQINIGAKSSPATGEWYICGAWIRNLSTTVPVHWGVGFWAVAGTLLYGGGSDQSHSIRRMLHVKNSGWVLDVHYDQFTAVGSNDLRFFMKFMDATDCRIFNPFMIRIPTALGWSSADVERLAAQLTLVSPSAKPGVVSQLAHHTFRTGAGITGSRPSASAVGAGAQWFDTTINQPIWSDGTAWRDAMHNLA